MSYQPQPGDLLAIRTKGFFAKVIRAAQWIDNHSSTSWRFNHAAVYISDGVIVEARPTGVGYGKVSDYQDFIWIPVEAEFGELGALEAMRHIGKPYGYLDLIALAFSILGYRPKWVKAICLSTKTVVCSQLAAFAAEAAGDRRWLEPFWVTPAAIAKEAKMFRRLFLIERNAGFTTIELLATACLAGILTTITASGVSELLNTVSIVLPDSAKSELRCVSDALASRGIQVQDAATQVVDGSNPGLTEALSQCVALDESSTPDWLQEDLAKI